MTVKRGGTVRRHRTQGVRPASLSHRAPGSTGDQGRAARRGVAGHVRRPERVDTSGRAAPQGAGRRRRRASIYRDRRQAGLPFHRAGRHRRRRGRHRGRSGGGGGADAAPAVRRRHCRCRGHWHRCCRNRSCGSCAGAVPRAARPHRRADAGSRQSPAAASTWSRRCHRTEARSRLPRIAPARSRSTSSASLAAARRSRSRATGRTTCSPPGRRTDGGSRTPTTTAVDCGSSRQRAGRRVSSSSPDRILSGRRTATGSPSPHKPGWSVSPASRVIGRDGSGLRDLTQLGAPVGGHRSPAWSNSGRFIAFVTVRGADEVQCLDRRCRRGHAAASADSVGRTTTCNSAGTIARCISPRPETPCIDWRSIRFRAPQRDSRRRSFSPCPESSTGSRWHGMVCWPTALRPMTRISGRSISAPGGEAREPARLTDEAAARTTRPNYSPDGRRLTYGQSGSGAQTSAPG